MKNIPLPLLILSSCLLPAAAMADDFVLREHKFDLSEVQELRIDGSVGEIEIEPVDGSELIVILEIEGKDEGWFQGKRDVSELDLENRLRDGRLDLRMVEKDTETHWRIALPAVESVDIDFGVGAVHAVLADSNLSVDLGVGEVSIRAPLDSVGDVDLDVGVGEARLLGAREQDAKRAFVSHSLRGQGQGLRRIRADLGVGEARVTLD